MLDISPVIVRFDNNIELQKLYNEWQNHAIAFTSTADLRTTANHLRSLILCRMPNTQPAFFRFYAHDWLYPLITEQPEETLSSFTGPIDQWFIPQAEKTWQSLAIVKQGEAKSAKEECWFTLTQDLLNKLSEYHYQQFIDTLTNGYTLEAPQTPIWNELREKVNFYVKDAMSYGFEQQRHISSYVDLAFHYPDEIESSGAMVILRKPLLIATTRLEMLKEYLKAFNAQGELV